MPSPYQVPGSKMPKITSSSPAVLRQVAYAAKALAGEQAARRDSRELDRVAALAAQRTRNGGPYDWERVAALAPIGTKEEEFLKLRKALIIEDFVAPFIHVLELEGGETAAGIIADFKAGKLPRVHGAHICRTRYAREYAFIAVGQTAANVTYFKGGAFVAAVSEAFEEAAELLKEAAELLVYVDQTSKTAP